MDHRQCLKEICCALSNYDYEFRQVREVGGKLYIDVKLDRVKRDELDNTIYDIYNKLSQTFPQLEMTPKAKNIYQFCGNFSSL